jgi:hypothetical protein
MRDGEQLRSVSFIGGDLVAAQIVYTKRTQGRHREEAMSRADLNCAWAFTLAALSFVAWAPAAKAQENQTERGLQWL